MKILPVFPIALLALNPVTAQDPSQAVPVKDQRVVIASGNGAWITGKIADGTPAPPAPERVPLPVEVITSATKRVHVVEAPEAPGLPAPEGPINITVQLVENPGVTDPLPPPLPALPPDDPAVLERLTELRQEYEGTQLVFVSATVYDHSRTFLRCYPSGVGRSEICCWTNVDFNHFSGFSVYQMTGSDGLTREYGLLMGLGNEDTRQRAESLAQHDIDYEMPEIPDIPDLATSGPAFVITKGDIADPESLELIDSLHNLYRTEGARMEEAYHARIKAFEERKAFLLANPPKPQDVTIRFWDRAKPSPAGLKNLTEGSRP